MKHCRSVGRGHGSEGFVEVSNMPAGRQKNKTRNMKTCANGGCRSERACCMDGQTDSAVGVLGRL
jgi:hypothetical protein